MKDNHQTDFGSDPSIASLQSEIFRLTAERDYYKEHAAADRLRVAQCEEEIERMRARARMYDLQQDTDIRGYLGIDDA